MLGVIGHGDADLFVAEGIGQLAGKVPAVGGVGNVEGVGVVGRHLESVVLSRPKLRSYREWPEVFLRVVGLAWGGCR